MGLISLANWDQLGYRRLGPKNQQDFANTKGLVGIMKEFNICDIKETAGEYWIRDYARIKNRNQPLLLDKVGLFKKENVANDAAYEFAREYAKSFHAKFIRRKKVNWDQAIEKVKAIKNYNERWRGAYDFSSHIFLMDPDLLASFLKNHAFPAFFEAYPHGEIIAYQTNSVYDYRFSVIRIGYTIQQYSFAEVRAAKIESCKTLTHWHTADPHSQPNILLSLASTLFYPKITHIESGPYGLKIVYIFDKTEEQKSKSFPSSWLDIFRSASDFGLQERSLAQYFSNPDGDEVQRLLHRRYLYKASIDATDTSRFLQWLIDRYNSIAFHLSDPAEFDSNGYVDFVWAFEQNLTFDRVLRVALLCICAEEATIRKNLVFELADLIEELRGLWTRINNVGDWFKELFNPQNGLQLVLGCLENVPEPFKMRLQQIAKESYLELLEITKKSVWVKTKITPNGVMVKNSSLLGEQEQRWPEFTANLMRAFRNTHHGYLTRSNKSHNSPSRYLTLVNGDIPDSISILGALWAIALIAAPQKMIGWQPMPISYFD